MKITVIARHLELDDDTKSYAEKKLQKIETFFRRIMEATMVLSAEKHRRIAEVTLKAKHVTFHATEETENIRSAIDNVMEKVEIQIKKFKEKLRDNKRRVKGLPVETQSEEVEVADDEDEEMPEPQIIKVNKFAAKPMTVQEAAMQMTINDEDFLVFANSETNQVNVVYRRKDGTYGWIEPTFE
ncbi:MAG: ribosome hibernation-promoting factor, HPF/YfiA family [Candidatus Poribacteria bacterium]